MYPPVLHVGASNEIVRRSEWTGMFMKRLKGLGVKGGASIPKIRCHLLYSYIYNAEKALLT